MLPEPDLARRAPRDKLRLPPTGPTRPTSGSIRSPIRCATAASASRCSRLSDRTGELAALAHVIHRAPDRITEFGAGRLVGDSMVVDVRVSDLPDPRPDDLIVIGADSFNIKGEPIRDRERLIRTMELRPS